MHIYIAREMERQTERERELERTEGRCIRAHSFMLYSRRLVVCFVYVAAGS